MSRLKRVVPLFALVVICLAPRQADASFISIFSVDPDNNEYAGVVYDGVGDVVTMSNNCAVTGCLTELFSALPLGFGVLYTPDTPGSLESLTVRLVLSLGADCTSVTGVECMHLSDIDEDWSVPGAGGEVDQSENAQALARLSMTLGDTPNLFVLTQDSLNFLNTVGPGALANARVGIDADFNSLETTRFTLQTYPPSAPASVPEPGTFALLAMGLGVAAVRSRRQGGAHVD